MRKNLERLAALWKELAYTLNDENMTGFYYDGNGKLQNHFYDSVKAVRDTRPLLDVLKAL